ncbi:MAG: 30S ribosomal protein S16 [Lacipirellulaceae bacterium]
MAVRIRMKKFGRAHRHFFRICAADKRAPRDGKVLEELGTYDPLVPETDARALLRADRIDYWLSKGAQPSEKVAILIKKYGTGGTHVAAQQAALQRLSLPVALPDPGPPASKPKSEIAAEEAAAAEAAASAEVLTPEAPASDAPVTDAPATEEAAAE